MSPPRRTRAARAAVARSWNSRGSSAPQSSQAKNLDPTGLIWEIEDPDAAVDELERAERQKRVRFFRCLGGELLARRYMQPPVDGVAPVPMRLMYRPAPGSHLPTEPAVEALVRAIYFEKYGDLNGIPVSVLSDLLRSNHLLRSENSV